MCVCVCVYLFVLCRNPNCWTDCDEIWPGGGPQGREGSWRGGGWPGTPHTPGMGCKKGIGGASGASAMCFGKNIIKQKLQGHLFGTQIWIRKDLGPMSFWSHDHSLWVVSKLQTSAIGSDPSTNWTTTTALKLNFLTFSKICCKSTF